MKEIWNTWKVEEDKNYRTYDLFWKESWFGVLKTEFYLLAFALRLMNTINIRSDLNLLNVFSRIIKKVAIPFYELK